LPPRRLPVLPGLDLAARRAAASDPDRVGGDWYDVTALSVDTAFLDLGDVGGHGPTTAALTAELCHAARAYALLDLAPSEITTLLGDLLIAGGHRTLTSAITARLDIPTGQLTWCNAGHPPPVLVAPDGGVSFLGDVHGPLLAAAPGAGPGFSITGGGTAGGPGGRAGTAYAQSTVTMPVGATIVFYSAGLVDLSDAPLAERLDALAAATSRAFGPCSSGAGGHADSGQGESSQGDSDSGDGDARGAGSSTAGTVPPVVAACDALLADLSGHRPRRGGEPDGSAPDRAAASPGFRRATDACLLAARLR